MILYYAMGSGLGHLTRARAVLHTLAIRAPVTLVTASPWRHDTRITGLARVMPVPAALLGDLPAYRHWLREAVEQVRPEAVYLDAFPAGLLGEWCDMPLLAHIPVYHVARLLRWPVYHERLRGVPPCLTATYVLEPLAAAHEAFLRQQSRRLLPLELHDPPVALSPTLSPVLSCLSRSTRPIWLIIHAGSATEILELVTYARDTSQLEGAQPRLVLLAPQRPPSLPSSVIYSNPYPATPLLPLAERIITACGFNVMRQTAGYREQHRFVPFPRHLDDQFLRAARHHAGSIESAYDGKRDCDTSHPCGDVGGVPVSGGLRES
jgi:hypothetical protein